MHIEVTLTSADGGTHPVWIANEAAFETLRERLGDPVWLLGATWALLTTNDYKRGRFADALSAWAERTADADVTAVLRAAGVDASPH